MARAIPYREALVWLLQNDDCSFLDDEDPIPSTGLCIVADIYHSNGPLDVESRMALVMKDLKKMKEKIDA